MVSWHDTYGEFSEHFTAIATGSLYEAVTIDLLVLGTPRFREFGTFESRANCTDSIPL